MKRTTSAKGKPAAALRVAASILALTAAPAPGGAPQSDYMLHCMGCHLADGGGAPGTVPSLRGEMARFLAVPAGRAYLVQVPGVTQAALSDAEIAALTNWMLERFDARHLPAGFRPYTAEEVARYRAEPLTDVARTRSELIERIERRDTDAED